MVPKALLTLCVFLSAAEFGSAIKCHVCIDHILGPNNEELAWACSDPFQRDYEATVSSQTWDGKNFTTKLHDCPTANDCVKVVLEANYKEELPAVGLGFRKGKNVWRRCGDDFILSLLPKGSQYNVDVLRCTSEGCNGSIMASASAGVVVLVALIAKIF